MAIPKQTTQNYNNLGGINEKTSEYTTGRAQFLGLRNVDFNIPNALNKRPGSTQAVVTGNSGVVNALIDYEKLNGESYLIAGSSVGVFSVVDGIYAPILGASGTAMPQQDFQTYANYLWMCNGDQNSTGKWNGATFTLISSPGRGLATRSDSSFTSHTAGFTTARYLATWVNERGHEGAAQGRPYFFHNVAEGVANATQIVFGGFHPTDAQIAAFGIVQINVYRTLEDYPATLALYNGGLDPLGSGTYKLRATFAIGQSTYTDALPFDVTVVDFFKTFDGNQFMMNQTYTPRFQEIYSEKMWYGGNTVAPSTIYYSETGDPEKVYAENFEEVRTNDSDTVRGLRSFQDQLVVFKERSFHKIIDDDPPIISTLSTEYGCLSNKAIAKYRNFLLFLDRKGVVRYNGSDWAIISHPIEDTFRRINIDAARDQAVAVHYDFRNQIWFGIPIDGSTENNLTIVFDYLLDAWTMFDGFNPASFTLARAGQPLNTIYYGDYSGLIHHFDASLYGDNGSGISTMIQPRFESEDGKNVQNLYRRLFLDVNPVSGVTGVINVDLFKDYDASTIVHTGIIYQNDFQSRIDFGVNARSLSYKMHHYSESLPLTVNGWATSRRYLREV